MPEQKEMTVQIVSIGIDVDVAKNGGGSYKGCEVIYKSRDGQVNKKGMHNNTFKYNAALLAELKAVTAGDYVHVTSEKNGEFVNWISVHKVAPPAPAPTQPAAEFSATATPSGKAPTAATVRTTYETPEERAIKQRLIVRQSSLGYALEYLTLQAKSGCDYVPTDRDVMQQAETFFDFIYEQVTVNNDSPNEGENGEPDMPC